MADPIKDSIEAHLNILEDFVDDFGIPDCGCGHSTCLVCARDALAILRARAAVSFLRAVHEEGSWK